MCICFLCCLLARLNHEKQNDVSVLPFLYLLPTVTLFDQLTGWITANLRLTVNHSVCVDLSQPDPVEQINSLSC